MAIRAGHRHLRFARFPGLAVALTLRGIGAMHSHRPALGTFDAPVPFTDDHLQLFGCHSTLRSLPGQRVAVENAVPWAMPVCMVARPTFNGLTLKKFHVGVVNDLAMLKSL